MAIVPGSKVIWQRENNTLNVGETKYSWFHKPSRVDYFPLKLLKLTIIIIKK